MIARDDERQPGEQAEVVEQANDRSTRYLIEVPATFAIAQWRRDADVATIARCILGTLKFEPHTADTTLLKRALESVIEHTAKAVRDAAPANIIPALM
jgi:hypothetical protein